MVDFLRQLNEARKLLYHITTHITPRFRRKQIFTQQKLYEIHLTDNCIRELVSRTPLLPLNEQSVSIIFTRFVNVCNVTRELSFVVFPGVDIETRAKVLMEFNTDLARSRNN